MAWLTSSFGSNPQGFTPPSAGPRCSLVVAEISSNPISWTFCFTRCATYQMPAIPAAPKTKITTDEDQQNFDGGAAAGFCGSGGSLRRWSRRLRPGLRSCLRALRRRGAGNGRLGARPRSEPANQQQAFRTSTAKSLPIIERTAAVPAKTCHRCLRDDSCRSAHCVRFACIVPETREHEQARRGLRLVKNRLGNCRQARAVRTQQVE